MEKETFGKLSGVVAIGTLPLGLLAALFVSLEVAAVIFIIGWLLLVPLIPLVGDLLVEGDEDPEESTDPVERLKTKYIEGELTEAEFDRQLSQLLETETDQRYTEGNPVEQSKDSEFESTQE